MRKAATPPTKEELKAAYQMLFDQGIAEPVLRDLGGMAGIFRQVHVFGDPERTAYNQGMRDLFTHILAMSGKLDAASEAMGL